MARYRVVKRLPWAEPDPRDAGRPPLFWEHEPRYVTHEPETVVEIQDCEVSGVSDCLEALDDEGRAVLKRIRDSDNQPARHTFIGNVIEGDDGSLVTDAEGNVVFVDSPEGGSELLTWVDRTRNEKSPTRRVLQMLRRDEDPTDEDLAAVIEAPDPPRAVLYYMARRLRGAQRKVGRKRGPRLSILDELFIVACFREELARLEAGGGRVAGGVRTAAYQTVADKLGIGWRTVQQAVLSAEKREDLLGAD